MELSVQSQSYHFLRNIVQEVRFQEETAEMIVPDSCPDISSIVDCSAEAILRGKDCRDGGVTIAGGVKGGVICIPEDQSHPRHMEVYIPFAVKFDHPALTPHGQVLCSVRVCSVDARMINSRKVMLRVNLGCEITVYENCSDAQYQLEEDIPGLQTKTASYTTLIPLETGEKSFSVGDTIEMPLGRPPVSEVYGLRCRAEVTDEKLVGNKAVFKGVLRYRMLYLSENGMLYAHEETIPFSQYCEMGMDYDEETVHTKLMITGYDLQTPVGDDEHYTVTVNILAQCVVSGLKTVRLIEDAYSTKGRLLPQWKEFELEGSLDRHTATQTVRHRLSGGVRDVLDVSIYYDYPVVIRETDKSTVKVPMTVRVLGYDESGNLVSLASKLESAYDIALFCGAGCHAFADPVGEISAAADAGGVETKCSVRLDVLCCSQEKLRTMCAGVIEDLDTEDMRPALIVRKVGKNVPLWEIAKAYRTTVEDILKANQLDSEELDQDSMLLLPVL